jgi:hypothetical protein
VYKDYQENGRLRYAYISNVFIQAKEIEKQQIIEAWIAEDNPLQRLRAEQYYNETFKITIIK